jgi:hypothetical protein
MPVVLESGKESLDRGFDVGEESFASVVEDFGESISSALLLDGDGSRSLEHGFLVVRVDVFVDILEIGIFVIVETGCEVRGVGRVTEESGFVDLFLLNSGEEDRHDGGEVSGELLLVDARDDSEEDVGALLEVGSVGNSDGSDGVLHEGSVVRTELFGTDSFSESTDGILSDTSELEFFSFLGELETRDESFHDGREVRSELGLRGVSGRSDSSDDGTLDGERSRVEELNESVHQRRDVRFDVGSENFEEAVESDQGLTLSSGVSHEFRNELDQQNEARMRSFPSRT